MAITRKTKVRLLEDLGGDLFRVVLVGEGKDAAEIEFTTSGRIVREKDLTPGWEHYVDMEFRLR